MAPDRGTIRVLQAGRALAALAVVLHHAGIAARDFDRPFPGMAVVERGYLGVDFFFVLSGFIIYHSTVGRGRTIRDYAAARLRRVYLPYIPVGIGIALLYTFLPQLRAGVSPWTWLPTLTLLPVDSSPALSVAWTLKHEMLFYLAFATFYFSGLLWPGLAIWGAAILAGPNDHVPFALINLEFLMGVAIAWLYRRDVGHPALFAVAALLVGAWIRLGAQRGQSLLIGLACAMAMLEFARLERRGRIAVPATLVFLGSASYALYLVHGIAISVAARIVPHHWPLILAAGVLAALAAGIGYHHLFERRVLQTLRLTRPASAPAPR